VNIEALDYDLPPHLIAQEPCPRRDQARVLVLRRGGPVLAHRVFADLVEYLEPGDLLVLNDTRVLPARLIGRRVRTGGKWEGLYLRCRPGGAWEMLCQTRGRLLPEEIILIEPPGAGPDRLELIYEGRTEDSPALFRPRRSGAVPEVLARFGQVPLPPYIRKGRAGPADRERYQTVYAAHAGSVAAPTAGLHFTPSLFEALARRGVERAMLTLHVGPGTFQPIQVADIRQHRMHREWGELPAATAAAVRACQERGRRVVAVGTTSVRVLETVAASGPLRPWVGETDLMIAPPYRFQVVDALVTNFHLPRSTLLLLVAAFTGLESMRDAYRTAVEKVYRFYSYGDAMVIL